MKLFLFLLGISYVSAAFTGQLEWYNIDGRKADNCVNVERLSSNRQDCSENSLQPFSASTFLIPSDNSVAARQLANYNGGKVTITGKFFPSLITFPNQGFALSTGSKCSSIDTSLTIVAPDAVRSSPPTTLVLTIPKEWVVSTLLLQAPRALCWSVDQTVYQFTGFYIGVVWNCDSGSDPLTSCANIPVAGYDEYQTSLLKAKTTCCVNKAQGTFTVNQCINPNVETCCGATALTPLMKCCSNSTETAAWLDGACPCVRSAAGADCPTLEKCCTPDKYPELVSPTDLGQCYNPKTHRCCDTGLRYDPGSFQCCTINGLQSLNVPCPCSKQTDCYGGQSASGYANIDFDCCTQTAPIEPQLADSTIRDQLCNKYTNYPTGNGYFSVQRCFGQCIDTKYQICCNGRTCIKEYERCCNTTCCNRWNGTCQSGTYRLNGGVSNWMEINVPYDVCTTVEQIDLIRAWWMFVMPTFMLIATLSGLALALVFAGRVEHKARRGLEKGMIFLAVVAVLFSCPMYFAPIYKYGCVTTFASLFAIIAAAARKKGVYITSIVVQGILIIYLIDPFNGNDFVNLAVDRTVAGRADPYAAGLWHATTRIWDKHETCWDFYNGYFRFDPLIRDHVRFDEPNNPAFGYCSRGWISALLVFDGVAITAVFVQFFLDILVLLIRGRQLVKVE